ncbi:MAG: NADH-quinone oxidoreductase subunit F [Acidobacteriota bacterium]|nr:dehydrogenase [Thermoanaerobaculaceae bacterium]
MAINLNPNGLYANITPEEGLKKALTLSRVEVIKIISDSAIKGRGGAGFPTGTKWNLAASAKSEKKYVICNADEGEPGTFKDKVLLSEFSDLLFEGMTIAGYAIGAQNGILYLRAEYQYLLPHLLSVLEKRRSSGLLGKSILGKTDFDYDIEIRLGSGAYVCGEETALIESLEGQRGEPRNRPPFPVNTGFMGYPTVVNNVETLVLSARIIAKGAEWFKKFGTDKSTGTKLFSVSGDCKKPGVYELPLGITVNKLLEIVEGQDAKAVQIGGASGTCVPRKDFERKIAYEDVPTGGSVIVFGPERDMLEVAHNFMDFFVEESCGQCTPCRFGTVELLKGIEKLKQGKLNPSMLKELISLGKTMQLASKCGLGQSAPNAFISIIDNFEEEILGREIEKE